jgi:hypothetical protein
MTWKPKHPGLVAGAFGGLLCVSIAGAQSIDELYRAGGERILQAQAQQEEIDAIVEDIDDDFEAYQTLLREIEDLQVYNNLLEAQVNAQRRELQALYSDIDSVSYIQRQILPLMTRLITGLENFISLDVPFLLEERYARVERLRALLSEHNVDASEKFRIVMESWLIEMDDYGSTSETYNDEIVTPDGVTREVQLLKIGRIALLYVTPNGNQAGAWNQNTRQWERVDDDLIEEIRVGIEAVETGQAASLFVVPVAAPEEN